MDVLDDILGSLRLTGGVVVDARGQGDWCLISQFTPERCAAYFPVPGTLIAYHYVRKGDLWAELEGLPPAKLREGAVLVLPRNDRHLLYTRAGLPASTPMRCCGQDATADRQRYASKARARRPSSSAASSGLASTSTR